MWVIPNIRPGEKETKSQREKRKLTSSAFIVGLVAAVGGFLYGYDTGLINSILEMHYVKQTFPANGKTFNVHERSLITAILSLGTFCGALTAPLISDHYGRKFSIILSSGLIFNAGNVLQLISTGKTLLCIGRAISGVAVGILSAIVPLYQAEASPRWVRGSVVYTYQWAITWGFLISSAVCQGTKKLSNSGSYRVPIGLQFAWALILWAGMLFLPESPRYYVQQNKIEKALHSLSRLRKMPSSDPDLIEELVEIKANYDYEVSFGKTSYIDCFRSGGGRHKQIQRMITGIGIQALQQCSGINFIFYYGVNFFANTNVTDSYLISFITYAVNTVFTVPGLILIDVIGRRKLLIYGGVGMTVSNFVIAIVGVSILNETVRSAISVAFSCVFIAFFASSWGGGAWAVTSDIYGISIRQKAISINAASNWLINFSLAYATPYLIDTGAHTAAIGNKIFFIWGSMNAAGVIFVYFILYETKGLKLEEIDYMYKHCHLAKESLKFKSQKMLFDIEPSSGSTGTETHMFDCNSFGDDKGHPQMIQNSHGGGGDGGGGGGGGIAPELVSSEGKTTTGIHGHNITMIPYTNISPDLSERSRLSTLSSGDNDYQHYLDSIHNYGHGGQQDMSQTSSLSLQETPAYKNRINLKPRPAAITKDHGGNIIVSRSTQDQDIAVPDAPLVAVPFLNSPPSDSSNSSDDEADDENV